VRLNRKRNTRETIYRVIIVVLTTFAIVFSSVTAPVAVADMSLSKAVDKLIHAHETVFANSYAKVDFTDSNRTGTVKINTAFVLTKRAKVTIAKDGESYTYDLKSDMTVEAYPLQMGNGEYTVKVLEQHAGIQYKLVLTAIHNVNLEHKYAPYLHPNQYVNYHEDSVVVKIATELTKHAKSDLEKVEIIYNYVVKSLKYDSHKAATVQSGYLPSVDDIIEAGMGICFDYAAVLTAMLRAVSIPAKLIVGYVEDPNGGEPLYHAWSKFYLDEGEFSINASRINDSNLVRVDPTFDSGAKSNRKFLQFVSDDNNYTKLAKY